MYSIEYGIFNKRLTQKTCRVEEKFVSLQC